MSLMASNMAKTSQTADIQINTAESSNRSVSKQERISSSSKWSIAPMIKPVTKTDHLLNVRLETNSKVKSYTSFISEKQLENIV